MFNPSWTKINSVEDLPKTTGQFIVIHKTDGFENMAEIINCPIIIKDFWMKNFSYWHGSNLSLPDDLKQNN